jgi:hypothetical protein
MAAMVVAALAVPAHRCLFIIIEPRRIFRRSGAKSG